MRIQSTFLLSCTAVALLAGCAGPEQKLGRGMINVTEFARMGEIRRSYEQSAIFDGNSTAATTGVIRGFDRSVVRTGYGLYEIFTFPFANRPGKDYGPILYPDKPRYPDSYKPGIFADQTTSPDTNLGFSGGDIAPMIPGSRFHVFDN